MYDVCLDVSIHSVQENAVDAPAFDGTMKDDTFAGSTCVVGKPMKKITCSGRHPKTKRYE